jgi:hypothetical protein
MTRWFMCIPRLHFTNVYSLSKTKLVSLSENDITWKTFYTLDIYPFISKIIYTYTEIRSKGAVTVEPVSSRKRKSHQVVASQTLGLRWWVVTIFKPLDKFCVSTFPPSLILQLPRCNWASETVPEKERQDSQGKGSPWLSRIGQIRLSLSLSI